MYVGVDSRCKGCISSSHGLPCTCKLNRYELGSLPLHEVHIM